MVGHRGDQHLRLHSAVEVDESWMPLLNLAPRCMIQLQKASGCAKMLLESVRHAPNESPEPLLRFFSFLSFLSFLPCARTNSQRLFAVYGALRYNSRKKSQDRLSNLEDPNTFAPAVATSSNRRSRACDRPPSLPVAAAFTKVRQKEKGALYFS